MGGLEGGLLEELEGKKKPNEQFNSGEGAVPASN